MASVQKKLEQSASASSEKPKRKSKVVNKARKGASQFETRSQLTSAEVDNVLAATMGTTEDVIRGLKTSSSESDEEVGG